MATCKDCVHYEICKEDCESGYIYEDENGNYCDDDCEYRKNKADFVEIVRCKNCIHGEVSIMSRTKDGEETWGCYCNVSNKVTDVDSYCPMGKKRGNEDGNKQ